MAGGGRDGDEGAFPARTALLLYKSAEAAPPGRKTTCVRRRRRQTLRKARVPIRSALPAPRKGTAHCLAAVGRRKRGLWPLPESGARRAPEVTGSPQPGAAHPHPTCCHPQCNLHFESPSSSGVWGNCGLNRATPRSKLPILELSRRQAPQEERFDENGGLPPSSLRAFFGLRWEQNAHNSLDGFQFPLG